MSEVLIINRFPDWYASDFNEVDWNTRFKKYNVILNSDVYEAVYPEHWGPLSIKFAFNGSEYYETENCRYRVSDGKYMLMNENQNYSSSLVSDRAVRSFTINFSPNFKREKLTQLISTEEKMLDEPGYSICKEFNFFSRLFDVDVGIARDIVNLKAFLDGLNYNSLYINEKLSNILEVLYRINSSEICEADKAPGKKSSTRQETYKRLIRAKDYIDSNFEDDVTLEILSNVSYMNQFHLLRKFKEFFGMTPHRYLTYMRLEKAKNLLKKKKQTVTDVCFAVGYNDLSTFSKLFKRIYKVSPDVYKSGI